MLLVRSAPDVGVLGATAAIRAARPELRVVTNEELLERFNRVEFSYFRQMSTVVSTKKTVRCEICAAILGYQHPRRWRRMTDGAGLL